jgi:hypothetical protein
MGASGRVLLDDSSPYDLCSPTRDTTVTPTASVGCFWATLTDGFLIESPSIPKVFPFIGYFLRSQSIRPCLPNF